MTEAIDIGYAHSTFIKNPTRIQILSVLIGIVAPLWAAPAQTAFFTDNFNNGSTVNSMTPAPPAADSTSYEFITSKPWNPATPSLTGQSLLFGINSASSGTGEMQAMFAGSPVVLATNGDYITLEIVFTNICGLLTSGRGYLGFGLYDTCGSTNDPVSGGLDGTASTAVTGFELGNAQLWQGYFAQVAYSGYTSAIETRPQQTSSPGNNTDQDVVTAGSGSGSFQAPTGTTVGSGITSSLVLNSNVSASATYTEVLTITYDGGASLGVTNSLYQGTGTNSTPLTQFGGVASGGAFLTSGFNALAIGCYQRTIASGTANVIDISSINIFGQSTIVSTPPTINPNPTNITWSVSAGNLLLAWPSDHTGWTLQEQTNSLSAGLGTNWFTVAGSTATNQVTVPLSATNSAVFYQLFYNP